MLCSHHDYEITIGPDIHSSCEDVWIDGLFYLYVMKSGIYEIHINGKKYVGSSKNLQKRKTQHLCSLKKKEHTNTILQNYYNKYKKIKFVVVLYCPISSLLLIEQQYLNSNKYDLNISISASAPMEGRKHSKETLKKFIGRPVSIWTEESKNKVRQKQLERLGKEVHQYSLEGNYLQSYKHPHKASKVTKISKQSIINNCNGYCKSAGGYQWSYEKHNNIPAHEIEISEESRFNMGSVRRGKKVTKEHAKKIAKANKERVWTDEQREKASKRYSKKVGKYDIETDELICIYRNVDAASKDTGLSLDQIRGQLYGKTKTILHYKWRFLNESISNPHKTPR